MATDTGRLGKAPSEDKKDLGLLERAISQDREMTDEHRLEAFRMGLLSSVLPDLPNIPGYKTTWLTTTNPRDSIPWRMRLGYEPVKPSDVPHMVGLEQMVLKTGEYAGFIATNEMLAFKIPISLWTKFMEEVHHNMPLREDEKLRATYTNMVEEAERLGSRLHVGDGIRGIMEERAPPKPKFS